jgi:hypothetical protein
LQQCGTVADGRRINQDPAAVISQKLISGPECCRLRLTDVCPVFPEHPDKRTTGLGHLPGFVKSVLPWIGDGWRRDFSGESRDPVGQQPDEQRIKTNTVWLLHGEPQLLVPPVKLSLWHAILSHGTAKPQPEIALVT